MRDITNKLGLGLYVTGARRTQQVWASRHEGEQGRDNSYLAGLSDTQHAVKANKDEMTRSQ